MRAIAIVNQKGGCGKTTTVVNLAGSLAADGARVLVIDMDPQAHATLALGIDPEMTEANLYEVLADEDGRALVNQILVEVDPRIEVAPSGIVLSALEQKLAAEHAEARTERLVGALGQLARPYDFALIDCPPNVGLLTFNALRAAQEVIIPLEASFFAISVLFMWVLPTVPRIGASSRLPPYRPGLYPRNPTIPGFSGGVGNLGLGAGVGQ